MPSIRKKINPLYQLIILLLTALPLQADDSANHDLTLIQPSLQMELEASGFELDTLDQAWPQLEHFYRLRRGNIVWHHNGRLNPWGEQLLERIRSASKEGLVSDVYHLSKLEMTPPLTVGAALWVRELLLTDGFFRLAQDLHSGQYDMELLDPLWHIPAESFDPVQALLDIRTAEELTALLDSLTPESANYGRLKQALMHYQHIQDKAGWPQIKLDHTLRPGMRDPAVELLRRRLYLVGDLKQISVNDPQSYDAELAAAVHRFQRRNGLVADALVGKRTIAALNVPVEQRIQQIRVNLERWRWLPQDLGDYYLMANTAGFDIKMVVDGDQVLHQRTINGKSERQTPSFTSRITHLVINPSWTVPRKIAVEDLLPKQQANLKYLDKRGIEVYQRDLGGWMQLDSQSLDWIQYHEDNFPLMLRQIPGEKNSLGLIKFQMANPYAIYLHDTPVKSLFKKPIRAFSSGCVRVQQADLLARRLLSVGGQSAKDLLDPYLQSGETQIEKLSVAMPVYLVYFTSWVDEDGTVQFRPDTYKRNHNLLLALRQQRSTITASYQPLKPETQ